MYAVYKSVPSISHLLRSQYYKQRHDVQCKYELYHSKTELVKAYFNNKHDYNNLVDIDLSGSFHSVREHQPHYGNFSECHEGVASIVKTQESVI